MVTTDEIERGAGGLDEGGAPRVTVLIPTWNRETLLPGAIDSVLAQAFSDFEVLVVDDGSTDGTAAMLEKRYGHDGRVRVLRQPNRGVSAARNAGVQAARAPLLVLLDSDDRCLPGRLARQKEALDAHPEAALCLADAELVGHGWADAGANLLDFEDYRPPISLEAMLEGGWSIPSTMAIRTEVARSLPFDETLRGQEDVDFLFRYYLAGHQAVSIPDKVVKHVTESTPGSATRLSEQRGMMDAAWCRMFMKNFDALPAEERASMRLPTAVHRRLAKHHLARDEWAEARPHCWAWWTRRPLRPRPFFLWLRCRLAG